MGSKCEIKSCKHWRDSESLYCQELYINACIFCIFPQCTETECSYVKNNTEIMLTNLPKECPVYHDDEL